MTTPKNNKRYPFVKFAGSLSLLFTMAGVLLAVGGQLNVIGSSRQPIQATRQPLQAARQSLNAGRQPAQAMRNAVKSPRIPPLVDEEEDPKYDFYDELQRRKTELGIGNPGYRRVSSTTAGSVNHYVVQVGAFRRQSDANKVAKRIRTLGFKARIIKGKRKFLTQAGPFSGMSEAKRAERRLRTQRLDTLIKRL